jgi:hypothetical protein
MGKANYVLFGQRDIARWASESYLVGIWLTRQKRMKWIGISTLSGTDRGREFWDDWEGVGAWGGGWMDRWTDECNGWKGVWVEEWQWKGG